MREARHRREPAAGDESVRRPGRRMPPALTAPAGLAPGLALVWAVALVAGPAAPAAAQDDQGRTPRIPAGIPLVVVPVQAMVPTAGGAWPGGASTRRAALEQLDAEVGFALSESEAARGWTPPGKVVRQMERNPTLDVDPRRLAYRGLLAGDDTPRDLHEPLHSQLRTVAALADSRLVAVPLVAWYAPAQKGEDGDTASVADAADAGDAAGPAQGRARIRLAMVDARAGQVLWVGEVPGAPAPADSPAALATLAANLVRMLTGT